MKVYRGAAAARHYVETDRSRAADYYLAEGSGVATRFVATSDGVGQRADMDGETYEQWVAGYDIESGMAKGRLRTDDQVVRFVEVTVNGPKTWSLIAGRHPRRIEVHRPQQNGMRSGQCQRFRVYGKDAGHVDDRARRCYRQRRRLDRHRTSNIGDHVVRI